MELRVASIGFGNVAGALVAMLREKEGVLAQRHGLTVRFMGAVTRRAGGWIHERGVSAADLARSGWPAQPPPEGSRRLEGGGLELARECPCEVVLELTTLSPKDGRPALDHVRAALEAGRHVVTANKGPIAHAYRELRALADRRGRALRFESTVMDGTPIFGMAEACLPATEIRGFEGVLNSTSNFILGRMMAGEALEEALREAQRLGIAEANPSYDLEGWDASVKAAVLANVLMGADLRPQEVAREGLGAAAMRDAVASRGERAVKQVVAAWREGDRVRAAVRLQALAGGELFSQLRGMEAALRLHTDTMQDIALVEGEGGPEQTALGVLADLAQIARRG